MGERKIAPTAAERSQQATAAAYMSWANTTNVAQRQAPALQGQWERFRRMADPDGVLPEADRERKARQLQLAHMAKMRAAALRTREERKAAAAQRARDIAEADALIREYGDAVAQ